MDGGRVESGEDGEPVPPVEAAPVALPEAVRQQLIILAGEVVGRLAPDRVPPPLRAIARFTPAKRARLGGPALAAVLDGDAGFRAEVADAVTAQLPDLLALIAAGEDAVASDPLDVACVAYLARPDGWTDAMARATHRLDPERGTRNGTPTGSPLARRGDDDEELARVRAELTALRGERRGEPTRIRAAVTEAAEQAAAEVVELRKTVRARTRELRAAERDRDAAREAAQAARRDAEQSNVDRDGELRRVRGRLADLERSLEAARRGVRTEREIDDARLWLLVDTLVQAANGVRRELSLAAPATLPADVHPTGTGPATTRRAVDAAALDRLLALPNVHLVVDGYNVTKTGYGQLPLIEQRARLIGSLASLGARSGAELTVVFDGGTRPPAQPQAPRGVRVLFSAADEIADDLIRRVVAGEPKGRPVVVVTSDRQVVTDTARDGAWTAASVVLLDLLGAGQSGKSVGGGS